MKSTSWIRRVLLASLVLAAVGLFPFTSLVAEDEAVEDPPIVQYMDVVNSTYKKLRKQARRLSFDGESLGWVQELQLNALKAMHEEPLMMAKMPAAEKPKFVIAYRKAMVEMMQQALDLEIALLEGRKEDAAKLVDALAKGKTEGHEKFTEEG
ncbi:MAG: hypothetical protein OER86_07595 [Phycisphaerae bacterium]|nr:hypothetical protein [Phycisphaerae bacterium]